MLPHVAKKMMMTMRGGNIKFLLQDEFITDRVAGAVNGTAAEPGGTGGALLNTRTVTDTDSKLTITGGEASLTNHTVPAYGDPGLWYGAVTRAAGVLLVGEMEFATAANYFQFGFDTDVTGQLVCHSFYLIGPTFSMLADASSSAPDQGFPYYANTRYQMAIILRATGAYFFLKGSAAFPVWTMIWESAISNNSPLYPGFEAIINAVVVDHIRIPENLWLPTALAYDSFTRADGVLGNSEIVGPDGAGAPALAVTARAWADSVGTWAVDTNAAVCSALAGGLGIATVDAGLRNVWVVVNTPTYVAGNFGIVASYVDTDNYIYAYYDGTNAYLVKRVGGVETTLVTAAVAYVAFNELKILINGTSVSLFYGANKAILGTTQTIGDVGLLAGTRCGLLTSNVGNVFDNFTVFPVGVEGQYAALNHFLI